MFGFAVQINHARNRRVPMGILDCTTDHNLLLSIFFPLKPAPINQIKPSQIMIIKNIIHTNLGHAAFTTLLLPHCAFFKKLLPTFLLPPRRSITGVCQNQVARKKLPQVCPKPQPRLNLCLRSTGTWKAARSHRAPSRLSDGGRRRRKGRHPFYGMAEGMNGLGLV